MDERLRREPGGGASCPLAGFLVATVLSLALWALLYALWCAVGA